MPTYEYACRKCGEHLEVVQSFRDDPITVCPNCGGELRKVFGNIGISFKGSGFYKTDSRTKSGAGKRKSDRTDAAASASGAGSTETTSSSGSSGSPDSGSSTPASTPASTGSNSSGSSSSPGSSSSSGSSNTSTAAS